MRREYELKRRAHTGLGWKLKLMFKSNGRDRQSDGEGKI